MRKQCDACKAKDQTITALAEQVDWLRMQLGTPWLERRKHDLTQATTSYSPTDQQWESEEEADIKHMEAAGLIGREAARAALDQMGAFSTDIEISEG